VTAAVSAGYRSSWRTQEHDDLADLARTFFTKEVVGEAERFAAQGYPDPALYRRAGGLGYFLHEAVLFEEQAYAGDSALGLGVHTGIVMGYLLRYGSEEQRRRWLPPMCRGELIGAIAMTEPGGGSDLQAIRTRAVRDGDEYVVTGSKAFITNGFLGGLIVVAVKTDPTLGAAGTSLLVAEVDDDTPGFRRGRVLEKLGLKGNDTAELFFDGVRVPAANLLGPDEGRGFIQLMEQLPQERLVIAVGAVAAMERAVRLTVDYTKQRTAFGKTLFEQQNTRFTLAECATMARTGRVFLDDCLVRHAAGDLDVATAAMAKLWLTESQIAHMYADARVQKIYAGANEVMKELVARSL
jgi:acyl-CoA dehydrogenase